MSKVNQLIFLVRQVEVELQNKCVGRPKKIVVNVIKVI